jgi:hypothetical protein
LVSDTAASMLPGFFNATKATVSAEIGSGSTPLIGAASIPTPAMAWPSPSSLSASKPPKECPITIGRLGCVAMYVA